MGPEGSKFNLRKYAQWAKYTSINASLTEMSHCGLYAVPLAIRDFIGAVLGADPLTSRRPGVVPLLIWGL